MIENTLLEIAKRNLNLATQMLTGYNFSDELYMNLLAYHLQQAVELDLIHAENI